MRIRVSHIVLFLCLVVGLIMFLVFTEPEFETKRVAVVNPVVYAIPTTTPYV